MKWRPGLEGIFRMEKRKKFLNGAKLAGTNALRFVFSLAFITVFQLLFGSQNVLAGVAVSVGLTMFPTCDLGIRPLPAAGSIVLLYILCGVVSQVTLLSPWVALPFHFLLVVLILLLMGEPESMKPSISFLICFVFCQAGPTAAAEFPSRLAGLAVGGLIVALATVVWWKKKGFGKNGRTLKQQFQLCCKSPGYILRMSLGISSAMLTASLLGLKKPLWISIVVMSLTQIEFHQTVQRIKYRVFGTVVGCALFLVVFRLLVPQEYAFSLILLLGYLSYFTNEYKYKQIVNAINAVNASLVLFDSTTAIENRFLCLLGGVAIVLVLYVVERLAKRIWERRDELFSHSRNAVSN